MANPFVAIDFALLGSREVSAEDQANIVEFLKALSGEYPMIDAPELS